MSGIVGNNTHRPLSIDEFRAFSITDDYAPLIFIKSVVKVEAIIIVLQPVELISVFSVFL